MKLLRLLYKKLIWVASAVWFFALFAVGWRVALENPLLVKLTVLGWHAPEVSFGVCGPWVGRVYSRANGCAP